MIYKIISAAEQIIMCTDNKALIKLSSPQLNSRLNFPTVRVI